MIRKGLFELRLLVGYDGSPLLWTSEIQDSEKCWDFFNSNPTKLRLHGPMDTARLLWYYYNDYLIYLLGIGEKDGGEGEAGQGERWKSFEWII